MPEDQSDKAEHTGAEASPSFFQQSETRSSIYCTIPLFFFSVSLSSVRSFVIFFFTCSTLHFLAAVRRFPIVHQPYLSAIYGEYTPEPKAVTRSVFEGALFSNILRHWKSSKMSSAQMAMEYLLVYCTSHGLTTIGEPPLPKTYQPVGESLVQTSRANKPSNMDSKEAMPVWIVLIFLALATLKYCLSFVVSISLNGM